jgi:hypothetical protein
MANNGRVSDRLAAGDEHDPLAEVDRRIDANYAELTEDERALIKQKAREHVLKVQQERADAERQKLVARATERAVRDAEKFAGLQGAFQDITLDLAPHQPYIMLDGKSFYHGVTYEEPELVVQTLLDIMARGWEHENEIHGRPRRSDQGRRARNLVLGSRHAGMSAEAINRVQV